MDFSRPNEEKLTNAIVVIGNQEFHVCKEFLAGHSLYFKETFFGNPEDVLEDRFPIDTFIDAPKFQELLEHLYHEADLNEHTVSNILKVSCFFKVKYVLKNSMDFLISLPERQFPVVKKIILVDKLELPDLLERVLDQYFAVKKFSSFLDEPSEPLRPATAFRIMERAIEQQKSSGSAPGAAHLKEKLRERLLKAEAQGPEAHMQERAIQLVLQTVNSENHHMKLIRELCGLNPAWGAPEHPISAREAERRMIEGQRQYLKQLRNARAAPNNPEARNLEEPIREDEDRLIHRLREHFPSNIPVGLEDVPADVEEGTPHYENLLLDALRNRHNSMSVLSRDIIDAENSGRAPGGLEFQNWQEVLDRRIDENLTRFQEIRSYQIQRDDRNRASAARGEAPNDSEASSLEYQRIFRRPDVPEASFRRPHQEQLQNARGAANVPEAPPFPVRWIQGRPNPQREASSSSQNAAPEEFPVETRWIRRVNPNRQHGQSSSSQNAPPAHQNPEQPSSSSNQSDGYESD